MQPRNRAVSSQKASGTFVWPARTLLRSFPEALDICYAMVGALSFPGRSLPAAGHPAGRQAVGAKQKYAFIFSRANARPISSARRPRHAACGFAAGRAFFPPAGSAQSAAKRSSKPAGENAPPAPARTPAESAADTSRHAGCNGPSDCRTAFIRYLSAATYFFHKVFVPFKSFLQICKEENLNLIYHGK